MEQECILNIVYLTTIAARDLVMGQMTKRMSRLRISLICTRNLSAKPPKIRRQKRDRLQSFLSFSFSFSFFLFFFFSFFFFLFFFFSFFLFFFFSFFLFFFFSFFLFFFF